MQLFGKALFSKKSIQEQAYDAIKKEIKDLNPQDIENIQVKVSPIALENAIIMNPKTGLEGKFSLPYTITNAILRDDTGMKAFTDEKVNDAEIIRLSKKVEIINDPTLQGFNSIVRISIDGKYYEKHINILNLNLKYDDKKEAILKKFSELTEINIQRKNVQELIKRIEIIELEKNIADLIKLLIP